MDENELRNAAVEKVILALAPWLDATVVEDAAATLALGGIPGIDRVGKDVRIQEGLHDHQARKSSARVQPRPPVRPRRVDSPVVRVERRSRVGVQGLAERPQAPR